VYTAPTTFQTEGDARVWLELERRLIETGQWTPPADREAIRKQAEEAMANRLTVAAYARHWLDLNADLRPSTRTRYESSLRYYVLAQPLARSGTKTWRTTTGLGEVQLHELTRAQVMAWWQSLPRETHRRSCDLAYNLLKTLCLSAVDDGLILASPVHVRGAGKPSLHRSVEPLTPAEVLAIADAMPDEWRLGVLLGAWCALRSGEVRELRRRDIDLMRGTIRVSRGVVRAGTTTYLGPPKTEAGTRTVRIPASLIDEVKTHLRDHAQLGADGLLFWGADGRNADDRDWRREWLRACSVAGVEGIRFHDLRHVGLTYTAVAGATLRELQAIAGHTTPAMAMRYQEIAADHMAEVVKGLDAIISAATSPAAQTQRD
jgi:integrase